VTHALTSVASLLLSALVVWLARGLAHRRQLLDHPNERSSHEVPTPRLGGVGIWLVTVVVSSTVALASAPGAPGGTYLWPVLLGGLIIAATGLADDLLPRGLSPVAKYAGQLAASVATVAAAGAFFHTAGQVLAAVLIGGFQVLVLTAYANFANFMDGSDGLVAGASIIALAALAFLLAGSDRELAGAALVAAAATIGFLAFNRPPASIFMGDSGSLFLGFLLVALGLAWVAGADPHDGTLAALAQPRLFRLGAVAILTAPLWVDAITTLFRRALLRRRLTEAHRDHLYQRMLRAGKSPTVVCAAYHAYAAACAGATILCTVNELAGGILGTALVAGGITAVLGSHRVGLAVAP
jgi:UDP-N-acetylmuramyl pentapeptide phosphotransferase/UDP-N-acetylglucosamine-1-phosphate transferase